FWRLSFRALLGRYPHFIRNRRQRRDVLIDDAGLAIWLTIVVACSVKWPMTMVEVYWAPLLLFFPTVFIFSLPEHYGCEQSADWRRNTRSVRSNVVASYLYWNGNFHADHHMFPRLPSRHLPRLNRLLEGNFAFGADSYTGFHLDLIRRLRSTRPESSFEAGVTKVLSPSERIHFNELVAQESMEMESDR
ncbi:MAG TPA: fatty acid desaturase, partial [Caballeronia sp.]|nr:fatty acid desaturase [Caballeronia sp.]